MAFDYPSLPPELQKLAESSPSFPDYSDEANVPEEFRSLGLIESNEQTIDSTNNNLQYEDLSWKRERNEFFNDSQMMQDATMRRAMIGFGKGLFIGGTIGGLLSLYLIRKFKNLSLPPSLHGYTIGGIGITFAAVKMVHDTRRYQEYIAYMQSGVANPDQLNIDAAKEQLGEVMKQTYHPQAIKDFKESPHTQRWLEQQLANK